MSSAGSSLADIPERNCYWRSIEFICALICHYDSVGQIEIQPKEVSNIVLFNHNSPRGPGCDVGAGEVSSSG